MISNYVVCFHEAQTNLTIQLANFMKRLLLKGPFRTHIYRLSLLAFLFVTAIDSLAQDRPFITTWQTDNPGLSNDDQIIFSGSGTGYDVYWENVNDPSVNGVIMNVTTSSLTITFPEVGTYRVEMTGGLSDLSFALVNNPEKLLSIDQWGDIIWQDLLWAFGSCTNLQLLASDSPILTGVQSLQYMFSGASALNADLSGWDVSNVVNMTGMFSGATNFNGDISNWDVSSVTSIAFMFQNASSFNVDISAWNVSSVWYMDAMFEAAISFDQNLGSWDLTRTSLGGIPRMLLGSGMSSMNYDATLQGWAANPNTPANLTNFNSSITYCAAEAARDYLINTLNWGISDGGRDCSQNITFVAPGPRTYGDDAFDLSATASSNLPVSYTLSNSNVIEVDGNGFARILGAGTVTITAEQDGSGSGYDPAPVVAHNFTVDRTPLFITAEDASRAYGADDPELVATYAGFVYDEGLSNLTGQETIGVSFDQNSAVGVYPIILNGETTSNNYDIFRQDGEFTITPAPLTIAAQNTSKLYGADNPALEISYEGFVNNEDPSDLTGEETAGTDADGLSDAGDYPITLSGTATSDNYAITRQEGTLTVSQVPLTVTAQDHTVDQRGTLPNFTVTYQGFVNDEDVRVLDTPPIASVGISGTDTPGDYEITVSGGADNNYSFVPVSGTLTITAVLSVLEQHQVIVYPNPVVDQLFIESREAHTLTIFSRNGGEVLNTTVDRMVDVSQLAEGNYILVLKDTNGNTLTTNQIIKK